MAKYIDADKTLNSLPDDLPYKASVKRVLIQAPAEDVVEVVRCKGCKCFMEYSEEYKRCVEGADGDCYLRFVCSSSIDEQFNAVRYDDYCSYGKRKEGNE